ncbi:MAG: serine hydrolase, partial [Gemmataceae bacterium]
LCCCVLLVAPVLARAQEGSTVTAEKVKAALPKLEKLAKEMLEKTGAPGLSLAVVYKDEVVLAAGYGVRAVGTDALVDADTVFQIASVSKPVSSTVIAAVVGEGAIDWDDSIVEHFPEFQMHDAWVTREVTVRDMLCHRSGLPDHGGDLLEDLGFERSQILHRLRYLKAGGRFRADYAYTNYGYTAAGVATARAAKTSWEDLCAEKLFRPLGMKSTSMRFKDFMAASNKALPHKRSDGKWVVQTRQPDAQAPAGGGSSSARDMAQYLRLQLAGGKFAGKQIVAARALAETHTPQVITGFDARRQRASLYGLGWIVGQEPHGLLNWNHSGAFGLGIRSEVSLLPDQELGIVVLSNAAPTAIPEALCFTFFDLVLDGKPSRDWLALLTPVLEKTLAPEYHTDYTKKPSSPTPALGLDAYVGTYVNDYFGKLEIAVVKKKLQMRVGPAPLEFSLRHHDRDLFLYQPTGENAGGPAGVTFTIGADGRARQVLVENLNIHGLGTFKRQEPK